MRRAFFLTLASALSLLFFPATRSQTNLLEKAWLAQAFARQNGCEMTYALQPIDATSSSCWARPPSRRIQA